MRFVTSAAKVEKGIPFYLRDREKYERNGKKYACASGKESCPLAGVSNIIGIGLPSGMCDGQVF
jgi:hypothetical protein